MSTSLVSRRAFLQRSAALSAAGVAAPIGLSLSNMAEAASINATDYKALVCVFLYGGNDHNNTIIPIDSSNYKAYAAVRNELALPEAGLLKLQTQSGIPAGHEYALHPKLSKLQTLFNIGKAAVVQNVGTLIQPVTLAQYRAKNVALPPKLFSHNDQQAFWQATAQQGSKTGWGGRIGDLAMSSNSKAMFTSINASGKAVFASGANVSQYRISRTGAIQVWFAREGGWLFHSQETANILRGIMTAPRQHPLEKEIATITKRSFDAELTVTDALQSAGTLSTTFNNKTNKLAQQLEVVAKLIKSREKLGAKRQVYMVSLGGFDTHDNLLSRHEALMAQVDEALNSFYQATVELGVSDRVTTFTASDFGRTFTSNGDGSDHGWGGHYFVVGGAVKGQRFYGKTPTVGIQTNEDVGQGRLLPTTSVDQYATTLAKWFGVADGDLAMVAPNIGNFNSKDLGFMLPA